MAFSRPLNTSELVPSTSKKTHCRFCGKMSVARSFVNLQSNEDRYISTLTKLAYMNIKPARKLHMNVCQPCHESFKKAYGFCQKFNHTQAYLANVYGSAQKAAAIEKSKTPAKRALEVKKEPQSETEIDVDDIDMAVPLYNKKKKQFVEHGKTWSSYTWICCYCDFKSNKLSELRAHASVEHCYCFAFECPDCDIELNEYEDFIEHVRLHKENLRFFCDVCDKRIPINSRHDHAAGHHQCERCGLILRTAKNLLKHKKGFRKRPIIGKKSNPGYYIITVPDLQLEGAFPRCDVFQSWEDYVWACSECDMKFHSASAIRGHSLDVHEGCFTIKCIDCNATTDELHKLILHIMRHRPSLRHFCPFCNRLAQTDATFRQHVRVHLTNTSYCHECGQIYNRRSAEEEPRSLTFTVWFLEPPGAAIELEERRPETAEPFQADQPIEGTRAAHAHLNEEVSEHSTSNSVVVNAYDNNPGELANSMETSGTADTGNPTGEINRPPNVDTNPSTVKDPLNGASAPEENQEEESSDEEESDEEEESNDEQDGDVEETGEAGDILHTLENLIRTTDPLPPVYALPFPTPCGFCQEVFKDKRLFREHTQTRYCLICDKDYSCSKNLDKHTFIVHMANKPFECYQCGRCYCKKSKAYDCMENHLTEEMGDCMVCESKVLKSFLAEHTEAHRFEVFQQQKICGVGLCQQKLTSWVELVKHRHAKHLTITFRKVRYNGRYMAQKNIGLLPQDEELEAEI